MAGKFYTSFLLFILLLLTSIIFSCASNSVDVINDPPIEAAVQDHFADAFEINRILGKGINLGNGLEAPTEGAWGFVIHENYIEEIKQAGFESVRVPIRWNAHAMENPPYTINESFFNRVDEVINWSLDRGLAVMINIHHYNELMENPQQHKERFLSLWKQIAPRYKDYPEQLVFEILNEPHDNLTANLWNSYMVEALDIIRQSNPRRVVALGTAPWGGFGGLQNLNLPENDRQLIATVHYYNPFQFTHQGASWAGDHTDEWLGTTWESSDEEMAEVDADFDTVLEWAETHNRPIHLGEFGAFSTADDESRERWTSYIREASELRDFSWAYWEFGSGFGAYDTGSEQWRDYLLRALVPDSPALD
jgi:endoglucanase